MESTAAHEFNHSIQFGYGDLAGANVPDDVFVEGGATWMEDEVFDGSNDNQYYLWPRFGESMGSYAASPYPYWVVLRGLVERLGHATDGTGSEQAMQEFWESISRGDASDLGAFREALALQGIDLASAYSDWALAVKFSRPCDAAYVPPFCIEQGDDYANAAGLPRAQLHVDAVGDSVTGSIPDNYSLSWVRLPKDGGPFNVRVRNTSGGGALKVRVACDLGPGLGLRVYDVGPGTLSGGSARGGPRGPRGMCLQSGGRHNERPPERRRPRAVGRSQLPGHDPRLAAHRASLTGRGPAPSTAPRIRRDCADRRSPPSRRRRGSRPRFVRFSSVSRCLRSVSDDSMNSSSVARVGAERVGSRGATPPEHPLIDQPAHRRLGEARLVETSVAGAAVVVAGTPGPRSAPQKRAHPVHARTAAPLGMGPCAADPVLAGPRRSAHSPRPRGPARLMSTTTAGRMKSAGSSRSAHSAPRWKWHGAL